MPAHSASPLPSLSFWIETRPVLLLWNVPMSRCSFFVQGDLIELALPCLSVRALHSALIVKVVRLLG